MFPRISCGVWWRERTSCGFPYRKPHTRIWLMQRAGNPGRPSVHGPKTIFSNAFTPGVTTILPTNNLLPHTLKAIHSRFPRPERQAIGIGPTLGQVAQHKFPWLLPLRQDVLDRLLAEIQDH
jgi:hypothetical protein